MMETTDPLPDLPNLDEIIDRSPRCVSPTASVIEAIEMMQTEGELVVVDGERLVGMLTAQEIVRLLAQRQDLSTLRVADVEIAPVVTLTRSPVATVGRAIELLSQHQLDRLPIVDCDGKLLGIVKSTNLLASYNPTVLVDSVAKTLRERVADLQEREWRFRTIFDSSFQCCGLLSVEGIVLEANQTALASIPNRGDLIGRLFWEAPWWRDLPAMRERLQQAVKTAAQGELVRLKVEYMLPDGTLAFADFTLKPIIDEMGAVSLLIAEGRDITERQQLEDELQQSEQKFRAIFNGTLQFVGVLSVDGILREANQAALAAISADRSDVIGLPFWETPWWQGFPAQQERLRQAVATAAGGELVKFEAQHLLADGSLIFVDFSLNPCVDETGRVVMLIPEGRDITPRKCAELALQESEEQFRILATHAPVGILQANASGECIFVNHKCLELTGLSFAQALGCGWADAIHPEDRELVWQEWCELATGRRDFFTLEFRLQTPQGRTYWVAGNAVAIRERVGTTTGFFGTLTDISERRAALRERQQAEESLQRMSTALGHAVEGISQLDAQGRYLMVNQAYARAVGYQPDEMLGMPWQQTVHAEDLDLMLAAYQQMLAVGKVEVEARGIRRDGSIFYKQLTMVAEYEQPGQSVSGHYCFMKDISDRKAAELALYEAQQRIVTAWESMTDAYIALDRQWRYTYANPAAIEIMTHHSGCTPTSIIGQTPWELLPELAGSTIETYYRQAMVEQIPIHFDFPYRSGEWFEIHVYPSAQGLSIYFRDITDRKLAQAELERQQQELKRSNQELQQFAYIASHDLQEPLRMISSYLELLERQYKGRLDERADKFIAYAVGGAARMQTLIQDLLSYSRLGTQGKPLTSVDCQSVLADALANLSVAIAESDVAINTNGLPQVTGDPIQLTQVFQNLIGNAIKFRRSGYRTQIDITAEKTNNDWLFSVRDNGIGIDRKYLDRIFVIFQRLHGRNDYAGTGIGLAVCKKIIERHGGKIWVESEVGCGSTFYFTIPARLGGES